MQKRIVHIDINSYFATILQQENPYLRNKPVGVLKSDGRTCIIAASKEAKLKGVRTGWYVKEAKQLCPEIILVPAQFEFCLDATKKLKALFESLAPKVEIFSLDEAFLDITDCQRLYPDAHEFGRMAQQKIKEILGEWVTCNVGISWNRLLAKVASETGPKGSVTEVDANNLVEVLSTAPFESVCGIGRRLEKRLRQLGVTNTYQINFLTDEELLKEFGPHLSVELRNMGRGEEPALLQRIDHLEHMKSVGRSITGFQLARDENTIRKVLYNLVEESTYKARRMKLMGRLVAIGLSGSGQHWGRHLTLQTYINRSPEMFDLIYNRLYKQDQPKFPIIKFAVYLGMLRPQEEINPQIWPSWEKAQRLVEAVDKMTEKYGLFTVRPGTLARGKLIRPEVTGFLGDKQFQFA